MERLKKLEIQRLVSEYEFIQSDIDFKIETINEIDDSFHRDIDLFMENHPKLKFLFEEKKQYEIYNSNFVDDDDSLSQNVEIESNEIDEPKNSKVKALYRQIARLTHPDMTNQNNLNEVYLSVKKAYDENNLYKIITYCDRLNLEYSLEEFEIENLRSEIDKMKKRLKFLESTFAWQWYKKPDKRENIILSYVKSQLIK